MAQSTYNTLLKVKNSAGEFVKLVDIKNFPDLGGDPELLESTTLSNKMQTHISGIQGTSALAFTANYSISDYAKVSKYDDNKEHDFEIWFGSDDANSGSDGIFYWTGTLKVWATGNGLNAVREMQISIASATDINLKQTITNGVSLAKDGTSIVASVDYFNELDDVSPSVSYAWFSGSTSSSLSSMVGTSSSISATTNTYYKVKATVTTDIKTIIGGTFESEVYHNA